MSQNQSDKTQTVKAPVIRVGDALVRKGDAVTGNPARTKYLGDHMTKAKPAPVEARPVAPAKTVKSKDARD